MDKKLYARVRLLFGAVLVLSIATLGVAALTGGGAAVWIRGLIVVAIAVLLLAAARRTYDGSRAAYRRMRVMSTVAPAAIVVIVALPHDGFPVWMKVEQAAVGLLLAVVAVAVSRKTVRRAYSRSGE
ncbi:hypothetical protein [Actinoallomurus rhizosphaericola]|uniref:hypothetical protein n=1 Tax=Actinoallomurus rhizosphaericola TaxID=2952536 RepID=UPI002093C510|nr:hypothetical protein [Actinoallomurus rhizosphaericola]MCO5998100.1 hypothetical protein [Actinoallomurus rhizosphaericola]